MKTILKTLVGLFGIFIFGSTQAQSNWDNSYSLHVEVDNFRNSKGVAQFAIYNRDGTIPDEKLKRYFKKEVRQIHGGKSSVTFKNLPQGNYAVTVHHDENSNGVIDKIFFYPKEGFGISNFMEISLSNRPDFSKACFELKEDAAKKIKLIYK